MTATSVPKGAKRRCESQGQERHQGEPAKMNTELIPKHNNSIGHSLPYPYYYGGFPGGFMAAFSLKSPRNTTLKSAIRLLRLLRLKWADFCLRRHHAENAEKEEAGTVFLPQ